MSDPALANLAPLTQQLQEELSPDRWRAVEARAYERVRVLEEVEAARAGGLSHRRALKQVAPDVNWSTYLNWWRNARDREGEPWERQLDARVPPEPKRTPEDVQAAACLLRRMDPTISCEAAQELLVAQFGEERGRVSFTVLKRVWKEAGLAQPKGGHRRAPRREREDVTALYGGGALALLGAAAEETGVPDKLGAAVAAQAQEMANRQGEVPPSDVDNLRDSGRFTGAFNRAVHRDADRVPRLAPDAEKRQQRDLEKLHLLRDSPGCTGRKLLAIGASPLLTERRGFDGLEGPTGHWLGALGGPAYADTTLDRCLAELALADVGETLWTTHAASWREVTTAWSAEEWWQQAAIYVDATQDPYWTRRFAKSGKVSRVGRVMPCLSRVAVMGGPGVPLVVDTYAGTTSLKKELLPLLDRMDDVLGEGELGRLTVVDAEAASIQLLSALVARPDRWFVTVLKGGVGSAAKVSEAEAWRPYREHDKIRGVEVRLDGQGAPEGGLVLRGVEMVREGSRNPVTTLFVTDASADDLPTDQIPTAYLSRWPHQEQRFRLARNGLGLERSHGYGGAAVTHVALSTKLEKAGRKVELAVARVERTGAVEATARSFYAAAKHGERGAAKAVLDTATRDRKAAERKLASARRALEKLDTMPREIYRRDTTRDGIATCLKLTVFMLIEFVLKEYFGGLRIEPRTFIELFVATPVTIRRRPNEILYELEANSRSPENTRRLARACDEINRRGIRMSGTPMRFKVIDPAGGLDPAIEPP